MSFYADWYDDRDETPLQYALNDWRDDSHKYRYGYYNEDYDDDCDDDCDDCDEDWAAELAWYDNLYKWGLGRDADGSTCNQ